MIIDMNPEDVSESLRELIELIKAGRQEQALTNLRVLLEKSFYPLLRPMRTPQFKGSMLGSTIPRYLADQCGGYEYVSRVVSRLREAEENIDTRNYNRALGQIEEGLGIWEIEGKTR